MESFEKRQRDRRNAQKRNAKMDRRKERSEQKRQRGLQADPAAPKTVASRPDDGNGLPTEPGAQERTP